MISHSYLTQVQAQQRYKTISNNSVNYTLIINLNKGSNYTGLVSIDFSITQISNLSIDYKGTLKRLVINYKQIENPNIRYNSSFIQIYQSDLNLNQNNITIEFSSQYTFDSSVFKSYEDLENNQYVYCSFQPYHANQVFPNFDQPDIKAKLNLIGIHPNQWKMLSNQNTKKIFLSDQIEQSFEEYNLFARQFLLRERKQKTISIFNPTPNISTYLYVFAAGNFYSITPKQSYKNLNITLYTSKTNNKSLDQYSELIWQLINYGLQFFQTFFQIPYPFSKCEFMFAKQFIMAAMENPGLIFFDQGYITEGSLKQNSQQLMVDLAETILHQLAHNWFGNLVTMHWWDDIWLNQSFADYMGFYVLQKIKHKIQSYKYSTAMISFNRRKIWGYQEDSHQTTHPVRGDVKHAGAALAVFDGISYSKGGSILKQIMFLIGQQNFGRACHDYFQKYNWKNTKYEDFIEQLKKYFNLKQFSLEQYQKQWLQTCGHNILRINRNQNSIQIIQQNYKYSKTLRHYKIILGIFDEQGNKEQMTVIVNNSQITTINIDGDISKKSFYINDEDHCFVRSKLDKDSFEFFKKNVNKIKDGLSRNLIWISIYEKVIDGQMKGCQFIELILNLIEDEKDINVLQILLQNSYFIIKNYIRVEEQSYWEQKIVDKIFILITKQSQNWNQNIKILQSNLFLYADPLKNTQNLFKIFFSNHQSSVLNQKQFQKIQMAKYLILSPSLHQTLKQPIINQILTNHPKNQRYIQFIFMNQLLSKQYPNYLLSQYNKLFSNQSKLGNEQKSIVCRVIKSNKQLYEKLHSELCEQLGNKIVNYGNFSWTKQYLKIFIKNILREQEINQLKEIVGKLDSNFSLKKAIIKIISNAQNKNLALNK